MTSSGRLKDVNFKHNTETDTKYKTQYCFIFSIPIMKCVACNTEKLTVVYSSTVLEKSPAVDLKTSRKVVYLATSLRRPQNVNFEPVI